MFSDYYEVSLVNYRDMICNKCLTFVPYQNCFYLSRGTKLYPRLVLIRISTRTRRNETAEKPAELVAVYLRVYCPGKQVPSVKDEAVHLRKRRRC